MGSVDPGQRRGWPVNTYFKQESGAAHILAKNERQLQDGVAEDLRL